MESVPYRLIVELGKPAPFAEREKQLRRFARHFEWEPSDLLCEDTATKQTATSHIVVEYGLQQSAVLTFLRDNRPFSTLSVPDRRAILGISFNNAVDWHLLLDVSNAAFLNNRLHDHVVRQVSFIEDPSVAASRNFPKYTSARLRPQLQRVDESLIQAIDYWRRRLSSAVGRYDINANLSVLFNSIIFVRVLEDQAAAAGHAASPSLATVAEQRNCSFREVLRIGLKALGKSEFPKFLRDKLGLLSVFDSVPSAEIAALLADFYIGAGSPYQYDFSMISRHALSLIYEKYVSIVRESDDPQLSFFPVAESISNRSLGTIYTPQFVARFFARYLNRNLSPARLATGNILDPACGSGVFLRCVAEIATGASALHDESARRQLFRRLHGLDVDASAVDAAQLSLALLYVSHFREFPKQIDVKQEESLGFLAATEERYTAIIANPPFVPWDSMSHELRGVVTEVLGDAAKGKADAYQAFLETSIRVLEDDGYLMFVLPQTFLSSRSAESLRRTLLESMSIEVIADLSNVVVFEDTGVYVLLLVARKRRPERQYTVIVRCRDFPGQALNEALHGRMQENDYFQVFRVPQHSLSEANWRLLPSREMDLNELLRRHVRLEAICEIRSGMVSGGRRAFTARAEDVPEKDRQLWPYLLTDREMRYFGVPKETEQRMFFPLLNGRTLTEDQLQQYGWTWNFLVQHRTELEHRAAVKNDKVPWWRPHRLPEFVRRPKLVAPHVALAPRFSFDRTGDYIVTQGPVLQIPVLAATDNLEWFLLAILNSALVRWQIQRFGQRYARGYSLLEPKTLREVRVPSPAEMPVKLYAEIVEQSQRLWQLPELTEPDFSVLDALTLNAFGVPADLSEMLQKVF